MTIFDDSIDDESLGAPETPVHSVSPEDTGERKLLVVLLDISSSMGEETGGSTPIDELNRAFRDFLRPNAIQLSEFGLNGELAIAAFYADSTGKHVTWLPLGVPVREASQVHWVRYATQFDDDLIAGGGTPTGFAISQAVAVITERYSEWQRDGVYPNPRPVLLVLTDGKPTDSLTEASTAVHQLEDEGKLVLWVACTEHADMTKLATLADKGNLISLGGKPIDSFIALISQSLDVAQRGRTARDIYDRLNQKWLK